MIDFKLASELKDAGLRLPPGTDRDGYTKLPNGEVKQDRYDYESESWHFKGEHYFIPTLEELIEECGVPIRLWGHKDSWGVATLDGTKAEGETPKIAVAKLFIILKKK